MNWQTICDPEFSGRVCLTLLHSIWQAALLAGLAWGVERNWMRRSVNGGYAVYVTALAAVLSLSLITYATVDVGRPVSIAETGIVVEANASPPARPAKDLAGNIPTPMPENLDHSVPKNSDAPVMEAPMASASSIDTPFSKWLWLAPWIVAVYVLGVLAMFWRLAAAVWNAHRLAADASPIDDGPLVDWLRSITKTWSMRVVPVLALSERIVVPKVVGLLRPTILIPASALTGLSPDDLEMILVHELAHVRRCDMWINLLQRLAEVVLFFNPALWFLSRRISALREYCCDDLTCRATFGSDGVLRTRYASALLRIVELGRTTDANLAALAAEGRSPSELRRRIARLFGEPLPEPVRLSRGGLLTLTVVMASLLIGPTTWHSVADTTAAPERKEIKEQPQTNGAGTASADKEADRFDLSVLGPDGKSVPRAEIEIRGDVKPTAEQVQRGRFVNNATYGTFFETDDEGRFVVKLLPKTIRFSVSIQKPGFGPYWAEWDPKTHPQPIPPQFTAKLEVAWTVGAVVTNKDGVPLAGVNVFPRIEYKRRPGDNQQFLVNTRQTTDSNGRWSYPSVPASMKEVSVEFDHPDYKPDCHSLTRSEFGIEAGQEPNRRITLERGLELTGTVKDESGKPIAGAVVRTQFVNNLRRTTTNADGIYRLAGCESRMARIVVSAAGKARDFQGVLIEPDMKPVDFAMKSGGSIRVRTLDDKGNPAAKTRIFFQQWRGHIQYFEFDDVNQYADENGVWEWNEAPLDEIKADICPPGGMQLLEQPLKAGEKEYVFHFPPPLVISGDVADAVTAQPVKKFRVVPGIRSGKAESLWLHWAREESFEAVNGHYELRPNRGYDAHLVRIEVDGYEVAVSREIRSDEGKVRIDFKLKPASDIAATIVTAAGKPATGAKVVLGIAGSQISVKNGDLEDSSTYTARRDADEAGQFRFPSQGADFQLVITHPAGFAHLKSTDGPIPSTVHLTPWARVEGTFRVDRQVVPNVGITLNTGALSSYGPDVPHIFASYDVTTGADGHFVFERVFPGNGRIGRRIYFMANEGPNEVTSSKMVAARFVSGETTKLDLGGAGRPVTGRLAPSADSKEKVLWNFARLDVQIGLPQPPPAPADVQNDPVRRKAWWNKWKATDEGKVWQAAYKAAQKLREASPQFTATVDREGSFRIDDVPAGEYKLIVRFIEHPARYLPNCRFSVPETHDAVAGPPIDLGVLTLQPLPLKPTPGSL